MTSSQKSFGAAICFWSGKILHQRQTAIEGEMNARYKYILLYLLLLILFTVFTTTDIIRH